MTVLQLPVNNQIVAAKPLPNHGLDSLLASVTVLKYVQYYIAGRKVDVDINDTSHHICYGAGHTPCILHQVEFITLLSSSYMRWEHPCS